MHTAVIKRSAGDLKGSSIGNNFGGLIEPPPPHTQLPEKELPAQPSASQLSPASPAQHNAVQPGWLPVFLLATLTSWFPDRTRGLILPFPTFRIKYILDPARPISRFLIGRWFPSVSSTTDWISVGFACSDDLLPQFHNPKGPEHFPEAVSTEPTVR